MNVGLLFFMLQSSQKTFEINVSHLVAEHRSIHHWNATAVPDDNTNEVPETQSPPLEF